VTAHLGLAATAFVDGELGEARREEVLAHLAWCHPCRQEVTALRGLKSALRETGGPAVPMDLSARLMAVSAFPVAVPVAPPKPARRRPLDVHPRIRRTAVGGAFVAIGLGGALSLAGPPPRQPTAPVDPTTASFVRDHLGTSREVPLTEVNLVTVSNSSTP
jgi:anti-sigma factor RsiW